MQEIAPHIYIEESFAGVTLGAINWPHGLILIDSPYRPEDIRSWRSALLNLGGGVDRLLVNLDAHFDRTLGARLMDCTVVGHEKLLQVFRNRPVNFKTQSTETGAEWELSNGLGSIRWAPPEINFTHELQIHWNEKPLNLEYHPGSATGAIWAVLPDHQVAFIGDAVVMNQPPFFNSADIPLWIEALNLLLGPDYQDFLLVSGRGGLVPVETVRAQIHFLEKVEAQIQTLAAEKAPAEQTAALIPALLKNFRFPAERENFYTQRLRRGLAQYYTRHFHPGSADDQE